MDEGILMPPLWGPCPLFQSRPTSYDCGNCQLCMGGTIVLALLSLSSKCTEYLHHDLGFMGLPEGLPVGEPGKGGEEQNDAQARLTLEI